MQYRIDPRSDNKLSALGFGCMRFSRTATGIDMEKAEQLILRAVDGGVNYFDTAYLYPGSEAALGTILKKNNLRDKVFIATKLPIANCRKGEDFERFWEKQLASLQTDRVDYYLVHNINSFSQWQTLISWGIKEWLIGKKSSGAVKQIGFSFHGIQSEFIKVLDDFDWDFTQIQYNYANENYQAGITGLKAAHNKNIPVIIMEPLLGGKLGKNLPPEAEGVMKKAMPDRSVAAWAFRWLWNQPEVTVVLSGMNAMGQLEDNLSTAEASAPGCMTDDERAVIEKVREIFKKSDKVPCTGCGYCIPCPKNVNIPGSFAAYNASFIHGRVTSFVMYITGTAANRHDNALASNCVECGQCEKHCPQNIAIRKELKTVTKRMEPWYFTLITRVMRGRPKQKT